MMKRLIKFLPFVFAASIIFSACKKNEDIFVPDPGQVNGFDTNWVANVNATMPISMLKNKLAFPHHTDSLIVGSNTFTSISGSGLRSIIQPNILIDSNNLAVSGKVILETFLLKKKGDLIRMNRPTVSNGKVIASAGTVFIMYKKEGRPLHLYPTTRVNISFMEPPVPVLHKLFFSADSSLFNFNWVPNNDSLLNTVIANNYGYEILSNRLGWINTGYLLEGSTAPINVRAKLSSQFTNANCMAYLVFKNTRSVVNLYPDINSRFFIAAGIPTGKEAMLVVLSKLGNDYYLGYESIMTNTIAGTATQQVSVTPIKKSIEAINQFLDNL